MKMPRDLPPAIQQQQTLLNLPIGGSILRNNLIRLPSPNNTLPTTLTEDISLIIRIIIDPHHGNTKHKNRRSRQWTNLRRVSGQIKTVTGVHTRNPNKTSPANVIPRTIMLNVHGAHVAHLPIKEFGNVNELEGYIDGHANVEYAIVELHVFVGEADDTDGPEHHTGSAVGEHFDVKAEDAWHEFHSPVKINNDIAIGSRV
mmetsp:Transcript_18118/g.27164  ORF Transcript_18118/g.27164 Transcript_18118/m.27164 type:complete len:201 (-) Transcript_18118:677-1279(-)